MDSILTSVKKLLGIADGYVDFDTDIIIHINSVFFVLTQLGVGPVEGFSIQDKTAVWSNFIQDANKIEATKSYIYMKVRLLFDPPQSTALIDSFNRLIAEFEWRLNVAVEPTPN